ncbi:MAG: hypothetical protein AAGG44_14775 [Planctomycetota bacterium]
MVHRHLASALKEYSSNRPIELSEFILDEQAAKDFANLKQQIHDDPTIVSADLGGNRWRAEYYHGHIVLTDDLGRAATNVVEIDPGIEFGQ